MNKKDTVSSDERSALKKRVDTIGRTKVCEHLQMSYSVMTQRLNGQQPLSPDDFERINQVCDTLKSK